jgi:TonB family protein
MPPVVTGHPDCRIARPDFSADSRRAHETGTVKVHFEISPTGDIENIYIVQSSGYGRLDESAIASLRASRCSPYYENGKPVRVALTQPFQFSLDAPKNITYSEESKVASEVLRGPRRHAANEGVGQSYRVNVPECDVRHSPNQEAPVFRNYSQGQVLTVFERYQEFARISPDGSPSEWVVFSLLQP